MVDTAVDTRSPDRTQCRGCGEFVTPRFARVFGDNDNRVYGCHVCMPASELFSGESGIPE